MSRSATARWAALLGTVAVLVTVLLMLTPRPALSSASCTGCPGGAQVCCTYERKKCYLSPTCNCCTAWETMNQYYYQDVGDTGDGPNDGKSGIFPRKLSPA